MVEKESYTDYEHDFDYEEDAQKKEDRKDWKFYLLVASLFMVAIFVA